MLKYIYKAIEKGVKKMTDIIFSLKKTLQSRHSPFSISPNTNYRKHVPESAKQLMRENWQKTGSSLCDAMNKVGEEIGNGRKEE